jgi:hypothetical protein
MSGDVEPSGAPATYPKFSPTPRLPTSRWAKLIINCTLINTYLPRWEHHCCNDRELDYVATIKPKIGLNQRFIEYL